MLRRTPLAEYFAAPEGQRRLWTLDTVNPGEDNHFVATDSKAPPASAARATRVQLQAREQCPSTISEQDSAQYISK